MVKARGHHADLSTVLLLALIFGILLVGYADRQNTVRRNCMSIENIKGGIRDQAQATITGDTALLTAHDLDPVKVPLPVPRAAVEQDIADKQGIVDRYPPRNCPRGLLRAPW